LLFINLDKIAGNRCGIQVFLKGDDEGGRFSILTDLRMMWLTIRLSSAGGIFLIPGMLEWSSTPLNMLRIRVPMVIGSILMKTPALMPSWINCIMVLGIAADFWRIWSFSADPGSSSRRLLIWCSR